MSARSKFAAKLKDRKGFDAGTGRNDPPAPGPPLLPPKEIPKRARSGRPRYSHSQHTLIRLEQLCRATLRRAEKAEAKTALLQGEADILRQRIRKVESELRQALRRAKKAEAAIVRENQPLPRLIAAWKRIEELKAELCDAKARAAHADHVGRKITRLRAIVIRHAATNLTLSGRFTGERQKLRAALKRIEELEAENEQLRNTTLTKGQGKS